MILQFLKRKVRQYRLQRAHVVDLATLPHLALEGWSLWPAPLRSDSVVYSFGVGDNVDWDLAMIRRFGVTVHAFDPTPVSIEWVSWQKLPREFVFHRIGLADFDGMLDFYPPRRRGSSHYSQFRRSGALDRREPARGRVNRLSSILRTLGHERIDVLKLDIEGSEFAAVPDLIASGIQVDQLLIEIHYQFRSKSFALGLDLVRQLNAYGMRCFHVSPRGFEFSFVRDSLVEEWLSPKIVWQAA